MMEVRNMFKKKRLTPTSLGIRILIGGYLVYLAYTLIPAIQQAPDTKELIFWVAIVAIFSVVGGLAVIFSAKALLKGEYDKGEINEEETKKSLMEENNNEDKIE
jgi:hypothetical protein